MVNSQCVSTACMLSGGDASSSFELDVCTSKPKGPHVHHHSPVARVMVDDFKIALTQVFGPCDRTLVTPIAHGSQKSLVVFGFTFQSFWTTAKESVQVSTKADDSCAKPQMGLICPKMFLVYNGINILSNA